MICNQKPIKGKIMAILMLTTLTGLLLTAGCADGRIPPTGIVVIKTDSNGTIEWITNINTGMQDYPGDFIKTSDGGCLFSGGISGYLNGPPPLHVFPRLVKLGKSGDVLWDTILNSTSGTYNFTDIGSITSIFEKPDGNFLACSFNGRVVTLSTEGTVKNLTIIDNDHILYAMGTDDSGVLFGGDKTMKSDAAGNLLWEKNLTGNTRALQTRDGRYLLDIILRGNDVVKGVICLSSNGTTLWTHEIGNFTLSPHVAFFESPKGIVDSTFTYVVWNEEKEMKHPVMTKLVKFNTRGDIIAEKNLSAAGSLTRTVDGGYVFVANPYFETEKFTTVYLEPAILHIVKLSPDGNTIWNRPLTHIGRNTPVEVIEAGDGGYVVVVAAVPHYE